MSKELNVLCFSECRFPSATTHSLLHWHDVIWRRHIAFDHIYGVTKEKGSSSKEMKRSQIELAIFFFCSISFSHSNSLSSSHHHVFIPRAMLEGRGRMYVALSAAAVKQMNFEVVEKILNNFAIPTATM